MRSWYVLFDEANGQRSFVRQFQTQERNAPDVTLPEGAPTHRRKLTNNADARF